MKPKEWTSIAKEALELVRSKDEFSGSKLQLDAFAAAHSLDVQTVRRYASALRFSRFVKSSCGIDLSNCSVAAVEIVAKWHLYSPVDAESAARQLSDGKLTVRKLRADEAQSRTAVNAPKRGRSHNVFFRRTVRKFFEKKVPGLILRTGDERHNLAPDVDFYFSIGDTSPASGVILLLGPHIRKNNSSVKVGDLVLKAIALTTFGLDVIVVIGDAEMQDYVESWILFNGVKNEKITVMTVHDV